jgi:hypothetical protein
MTTIGCSITVISVYNEYWAVVPLLESCCYRAMTMLLPAGWYGEPQEELILINPRCCSYSTSAFYIAPSSTSNTLLF